MNNSQWQGNTNWLLAQTYEAHDFPYTHTQKQNKKPQKAPQKTFFLISLFLRYKYIYIYR